MALIYADRIKETSTTIGTGNFLLGGAIAKFRSFSAGVGAGNESYYVAVNDTDNSWEVGKGTLVSATSLSRDSIIASSNSNLAVNFLVGTKTIAAVAPSTFFTAALNSASHALINHAGLPGVPAPETFTSVVHQSVDHTLPPFNLFNAAVHDAVNHKVAPFNLLDEPAHDLLDHTGLPGIPTIPTNTSTTLFCSGTDAIATATGSFTTLHTFTLSPSQFANNGDQLVIEGWVTVGIAQPGTATLSFSGITIFTESRTLPGRDYYYIIRIIRKSSTSQLLMMQFEREDSTTHVSPTGIVSPTQPWAPRSVGSIPLLAANLAASVVIQIQGVSTGSVGNAVNSRYFSVRKIPA